MQKYTDKELVELLETSDNRNYVFSFVVEAYKERLYWHIRRMVVDHSDADDILQDVFVKAWTKFDSFEGRSQLFTWLYKIATNQCLEFLKKKKRKAMFTFTDVDNEMSQKLTADNYFDGNEAELKLQQAILTLPEKQRLVFNMKYFDEMKYDDMSSVLGTSVGALKASYHQAVKKIEKFVTQE